MLPGVMYGEDFGASSYLQKSNVAFANYKDRIASGHALKTES